MALYNTELKKMRTPIDCLSCKHYNKRKKLCEGIGIVCYEFDEATNTLIEPMTGLGIKLKEKEN